MQEDKLQLKNLRSFFQSMLIDLFNIVHNNVLEIISIEENRQFLIDQRKHGRRELLISVNVSLKKKEDRRGKEKINYESTEESYRECPHFAVSNNGRKKHKCHY